MAGPGTTEILRTQVFDRPGVVLLVEDESIVGDAIAGILEMHLHRVVRASSGAEAVALAQEHRPDVILLDIGLPDVSGLEVCKAFKADAELKFSAVIVVTGHADAESQIQGFEAGANDVLIKPVNPMVLAARVRSALKYRNAIAEIRKARSELERRVEERTVELRRINEELKAEIFERRRVEEALRLSEERYALAAQGANDGLWDWNLKEFKIYYSPRWKQMLGCEENEITEAPSEWLERVHPEDRAKLKSELEVHLQGTTDHFETEFRVQHKDGSYLWMLCRGMAVRDARGVPYRIAGSQTDITAEKTAQLQILHDAFHDSVTGLPNRTLFMDRVGQAMRRTERREDQVLCVLYLGLDRFKLINESLGHKAGDQLLLEVGRRLTASVHTAGSVARIGSDEFGVLLEGAPDAEAARAEADRIKAELARPFKVASREIFGSASIGIALRSKRHKSAEDLLRDAHTAMHRAKALGKAGQEVFYSGLHKAVVSELELETELRHALDRGEFQLYYQPIVNLSDRRTVGFEALLRWRRNPQMMVAPGEFIPLAEETGLIVPMTWWVMREACRQARAWEAVLPADSNLYLSINLASQIFQQANLAPLMQRALEEAGVKPARLRLEITESAIMGKSETVAATLERLKDLGLLLILDDFGTGYSSLSYLHQLPIDMIKVDKSFVGRIGADGENAEIVRTILSLAQNLKLPAVAEGVETEAQFRILREMACDYAQGFLFSRPMEAEAATQWVKEKLAPPTAKSMGA
ncbi:MAG: EAL domain-containing protein [Planctomycetota bacterium]|nr:EAL domain-containing protein [Planctomycetota bacterium]